MFNIWAIFGSVSHFCVVVSKWDARGRSIQITFKQSQVYTIMVKEVNQNGYSTD
jgi:hypothetical protein